VRRLSTERPRRFSITYLLVWTATKSATQDFALVRLALGAGAMDTVERCFFVAAAASLFVLIGFGLMSP
jgi:hypothetical protein